MKPSDTRYLLLLAFLPVVVACVTKVYAPVTIDTNVCLDTQVTGILTAGAAKVLAGASDACLTKAHEAAVQVATNPDAGAAAVEHHSKIIQWILDELKKRRHRDGGAS